MTDKSTAKNSHSGRKILQVMRLIAPHFAHGVLQNDIVKSLGMPPATVFRYTQALKEEGFIEEIPETGRLRPSHQFARWGVAQLQSLDKAEDSIKASRARLSTIL